MQFVGIAAFVVGYAATYTGVQMLKRPPDGTSGSFLYWLTGIVSLGSPSGGSASGKSTNTVNQAPTTGGSQGKSPQSTGGSKR